ncbi:hypothetical protein Ga0074812_101315 [Parafrankia irregularis]|uniref:Uncharacterized protein n=1 Tax=Parafrankia irregularis TaxID=795642 RepID=A0A0S4QEZ7_9ACTN|nr:hypothetical protein Ga0074812_101315 [Parafrankia irregularis]
MQHLDDAGRAPPGQPGEPDGHRTQRPDDHTPPEGARHAEADLWISTDSGGYRRSPTVTFGLFCEFRGPCQRVHTTH